MGGERWRRVMSRVQRITGLARTETSIVSAASAQARRTVLLALVGSALILGCFLLERLAFQRAQDAAVTQLIEARYAADVILLADERLTMSAVAAAATGESRWIQRYDDNIPLIDGAIADALVLAPEAVAARFDAETRSSNDALVALERASFAAVERGDAAAARALLAGEAYARHKEVLSQGTARFIDGTMQHVRAHLRGVRTRGQILIGLIGVGALIGACALWRGLLMSLARSEEAFLDAEKKIQRLAMNDMLTGLANRHALREALPAAMRRADRGRSRLAVVMLDLDRFKPINDVHGHMVGDLVLKEIAQRLGRSMRGGEIRARLGGDEFVVVLEYGADSEAPRQACLRLLETLSAPMSIDTLSLSVGVSLGYAVYPDDASTSEELFRKADLALYAAKHSGRGTICAFEAELDEDSQTKARMEIELRAAIAQGEIEPFFQPLVQLSSGAVRGLEVLARWNHPQRGLVMPAVFIPIAEDSGLIGALTASILRQACLIGTSLPEHLSLAVNIAAQELQDESLIETIAQILRETGFPARRLEIELTENALVSNLSMARRIIHALKQMGVRIALDDFGTGYSSLNYLAELPFDKIKIDRSFVRSLHDRAESIKIVSAIVGLGRSLGVDTLAEGVETTRDEAVLREIGCDSAQGYLYRAPMDIGELRIFLDRLAPPVAAAVLTDLRVSLRPAGG